MAAPQFAHKCEIDKDQNMFEELAQSDANCLILIQTSTASEDLSSNTLAFLSCQIPHASAKQQLLHSNFDFFYSL